MLFRNYSSIHKGPPPPSRNKPCTDIEIIEIIKLYENVANKGESLIDDDIARICVQHTISLPLWKFCIEERGCNINVGKEGQYAILHEFVNNIRLQIGVTSEIIYETFSYLLEHVTEVAIDDPLGFYWMDPIQYLVNNFPTTQEYAEKWELLLIDLINRGCKVVPNMVNILQYHHNRVTMESTLLCNG